MKAEIILTAQGHAGTLATLQNEFTCHKLFEAADRAAFLARHAQSVRAIEAARASPSDNQVRRTPPLNPIKRGNDMSARSKNKKNHTTTAPLQATSKVV